MQGMGSVEGILRAPGQLHVGRSNGLLVGIDAGLSRDERQRFFAGPAFNSRDVLAAGQEEIFVQIGMAEIDTVELTVEFGQILA